MSQPGRSRSLPKRARIPNASDNFDVIPLEIHPSMLQLFDIAMSSETLQEHFDSIAAIITQHRGEPIILKRCADLILKKINSPQLFDPTAANASDAIKKIFYSTINTHPAQRITDINKDFIKFIIATNISPRVAPPGIADHEYHKHLLFFFADVFINIPPQSILQGTPEAFYRILNAFSQNLVSELNSDINMDRLIISIINYMDHKLQEFEINEHDVILGVNDEMLYDIDFLLESMSTLKRSCNLPDTFVPSSTDYPSGQQDINFVGGHNLTAPQNEKLIIVACKVCYTIPSFNQLHHDNQTQMMVASTNPQHILKLADILQYFKNHDFTMADFLISFEADDIFHAICTILEPGKHIQNFPRNLYIAYTLQNFLKTREINPIPPKTTTLISTVHKILEVFAENISRQSVYSYLNQIHSNEVDFIRTIKQKTSFTRNFQKVLDWILDIKDSLLVENSQ
eukprot:767572-Hanusia_phi.AAC.2